jgi:hypothetical protein
VEVALIHRLLFFQIDLAYKITVIAADYIRIVFGHSVTLWGWPIVEPLLIACTKAVDLGAVRYLADHQKRYAAGATGQECESIKLNHAKGAGDVEGSGRNRSMRSNRGNEAEMERGLRPHDAGFDFRFPDHIAGLQAFNADLALL